MRERSVVLPATIDEASALLAGAAARGATVAIRGAALGWTRREADLVVGTAKLDQVIEHEAGDLVARVQAGATMGHLAEVLARHGQRLSLDVPPQITVGGMLATGTAGPLRFRYGSPRDLLIGITVVRPDGVLARAGGKVVKNVAGYDLGKLFAGSHGTLGLIAEATFRLHPLPQAVAYLTAPFPDTADAGGASADGTGLGTAATADAARAVGLAAGSPAQPAAVELDWPADGTLTVGVLLEGTESGVAERARLMTGLLREAGAASVTVSAGPPAWWGALPGPATGPLIRTTFWLSRLGDVLGLVAGNVSLATGGGSLVAGGGIRGSAGAGLLYLAPADIAGAGDLVAGLRALLGNRGDASVLTEPWAPSDPLSRAVREQFDPDGRFG